MDPKPTQKSAAPRRSNVVGVIACNGDSLTFGARDPGTYREIAEERRLQIVDLTDMTTEHFLGAIEARR